MPSAEAILAAQALRQRAEATLAQRSGLAPPQAAAPLLEMMRQTHELQVHQIELEMQNDELRKAQLATQASQAQFADLYDHAPVGYVSIDAHGMVTQANQTAAALLGLTPTQLALWPLSHFIKPADQDTYYLLCKRTRATRQTQTAQLHLLCAGGQTVWVDLAAACVPGDSDPGALRVTLSDSTERHAAEEKLSLAARFFCQCARRHHDHRHPGHYSAGQRCVHPHHWLQRRRRGGPNAACAELGAPADDVFHRPVA